MTSAPQPILHRLAWATDIHLNFLDAHGVQSFADQLARQNADATLVTGDIAEAPSVEPLLVALAEALKKPIFFVLGNHDAYGGSIHDVRARVAELSRRSPWLRWLPALGVVELGPEVALVGVDGWADGRLGSFARSDVLLNDYVLIKELAGLEKEARLRELHRLGDEQADLLRGPLQQGLERYRRVIVATHVPPFKEACWHEGKISNDDWLPHFTCKAVGDALLNAAKAWPDRQIMVLCGHTHGVGAAQILPNLSVYTGGADYGAPRVQGVIESV